MRAHLRNELVEEVIRIVRPRSGFGVILHGKYRQAAVPHSLQTSVVQIEMRQLDFVLVQAVGGNRETVIVRSDLDAARTQIFHRLVAAAMAELEFVRAAAERPT